MTITTETRVQTDEFSVYERHHHVLSYEYMDELELFDDLRYGDVKKYFGDKDDVYDVSFQYIQTDNGWLKVEMIFSGMDDDAQEKSFKTTIEYQGSSKYAMIMSGIMDEIEQNWLEYNS